MGFSPTGLFIAFVVIDILVLMLSLFRLCFRIQIRRFWWEDGWAAVVFVCGMIFVVSGIVEYMTGKTIHYCSSADSHEAEAVLNWMMMHSFTSTVWAVRMSLLYSTIRVMSPLTVLRKIARVVAVLFIIFWSTLIVLKTWWCVGHAGGFTSPTGRNSFPMCQLRVLIVCFQVVTDCISDSTLVVLSLKLLWRVKLPRRQRRMILSLFSSSMAMSSFSLFHAICQFFPTSNVENLAWDLEMTSALIVCNLLVVVTYMYRVILSSRDGSLPSESEGSSEDDDFTTRNPARRTTDPLTTVNLDTVSTFSNLNVTSGVFPSLRPSSGLRQGMQGDFRDLGISTC